jgi:membrane fusion protein (multidrug efflux system)
MTMMLDAKIRLLKDRISKKSITAPFDGYVVDEHVHVGMWVQRGGMIVRMVRVEPIYVTVQLPQSFLNQVAVGDEPTVSLKSGSESTLKGKVDAVIALGDTSSRTFPVKIRLDNPDHRLKPGMLAYATFKVGEKRKAIVVPKDAVVISPSGDKMVYVMENGMVRPSPVITGGADNSYIEVNAKGLTIGQTVVTVGNERLRPGQPVAVVGEKKKCNPASATRGNDSHDTNIKGSESLQAGKEQSGG